jgi:glyoxylase-like metal-dependent hydrolase (beta-lactamase superfamily II)
MVDNRAGITALGHDVYAIDTYMSGYDGITAAYLIRGSAPCLVETGTAASADAVRRALVSLDIGADDLATIAVTHIHLDHAGGVGDLAASFPRARIVVHESGARHLADPTRLLDSARRVFGAEVVDDVLGGMVATDATRLSTVADSGLIDLGDGRALSAIYSPGHARHHLGFVDETTGDLYVGDAAGLYVPQTGDVRPATPPPDFDLDLALASLSAFARRAPSRLLFSHFGPVSDVATTLQRSAEELRVWVDLAREARGLGYDLDHAVAWATQRTADRYQALVADPGLLARFESLNSTAANLAGINRWLDRVEGVSPAGPPAGP